MKSLLGIFLCVGMIGSFSGITLAQSPKPSVLIIKPSETLKQQIKQKEAELAILKDRLEKIEEMERSQKAVEDETARREMVAKWFDQKNPRKISLELTPSSPFSAELRVRMQELSPANQKLIQNIIADPGLPVANWNKFSRTKLELKKDAMVFVASCIDPNTGGPTTTCAGHLLGIELTVQGNFSPDKYLLMPVFKGGKINNFEIKKVEDKKDDVAPPVPYQIKSR